jgi:sialidase-1
VASSALPGASGRITVAGTKDLFRSGEGGFHTFRVPALVETTDGSLLAFAEGRRNGVSDTGLIEMVLRRSEDGGETFGPLEVVVQEPSMTCGNPTPTVDPRSGTVLLPFCKNPEDGPEQNVFDGTAARTAWLTKSEDGGRTWDVPVEITRAVKPEGWSWFAFGPGHGLALASGRLVVPSVHACIVDGRHSDPCRAHVTLSDDGGKTFRVGGVVDVPTSSECELVEIAPDVLYMNVRYEAPGAGRISAWSRDGGESFDEVVIDPAQTDPCCQGSIALANDGTGRIVLLNALGPKRQRLAVKVSEDGGRSFGGPTLLEEGRAAYSDVVAQAGGNFACLYECGSQTPYEKIVFSTFRLD